MELQEEGKKTFWCFCFWHGRYWKDRIFENLYSGLSPQEFDRLCEEEFAPWFKSFVHDNQTQIEQEFLIHLAWGPKAMASEESKKKGGKIFGMGSLSRTHRVGRLSSSS
ncbi:uncharacterized protein LOC121981008 [Zingiber officinale]|uniref:uncharacterized protein LOC121981008 n=1 Tax=Zingiber officinale TaxID=94328 RepID=UPI001C4CF1C7|nr:uncharacterized protein LOC121981008 [Zingiber officinale]